MWFVRVSPLVALYRLASWRKWIRYVDECAWRLMKDLMKSEPGRPLRKQFYPSVKQVDLWQTFLQLLQDLPIPLVPYGRKTPTIVSEWPRPSNSTNFLSEIRRSAECVTQCRFGDTKLFANSQVDRQRFPGVLLFCLTASTDCRNKLLVRLPNAFTRILLMWAFSWSNSDVFPTISAHAVAMLAPNSMPSTVNCVFK